MSHSGIESIRVGIGGWNYAPWRATFYPEGLAQKRELEFASRRLTSIEINATYHRTQKPETFVRWRDETPDGFVFAVKGPRFVTNRRVLRESGSWIERFFASGVLELGDKLGPINWQLMPTKKFDADDLEAFLSSLPKNVDGREIRHAVEVRNESFRTGAFVALARAYGVAVVVTDKERYPQIADATAPFVYARLQLATESFPAGYPPEALDGWAERAKVWAAGGVAPDLARVLEPEPADTGSRDVYIYFINGFKESNPRAAMELIARLGARA